MKTLVLIPAYNEDKTIGHVIEGLLKLKIFDVLVIDDGSYDDTYKIASSFGIVILKNETNLGKGAALKRGFDYAVKNEYDAVIDVDSDGQHKIEDVLLLYESAHHGNDADVLIGNRMWKPSGMPFIRKITNAVMSGMISFMTGTKIPDTQCGLKLIKTDVLKKLSIYSDKFEAESEILFEILRKGYKIKSVNITSVYFEERKSRIRPLRDTIRFLRCIARATLKQ